MGKKHYVTLERPEPIVAKQNAVTDRAEMVTALGMIEGEENTGGTDGWSGRNDTAVVARTT